MTSILGMNFELEWDYRYNERIGMLCGTDEPAAAEKKMAREESDAACREFRKIHELLETYEAV